MKSWNWIKNNTIDIFCLRLDHLHTIYIVRRVFDALSSVFGACK